MAYQHMNGESRVQTENTMPTSGSSYTILSDQSRNNGYINVYTPSSQSLKLSMTDITLEKAMEKVQDLATENATLREYLKENNQNMKKQFQTLMQWKEKVKESNKQYLLKFEQLHKQISILKSENDKYKQCLASPDQQGTLLEQLQTHIRLLEEEKFISEKGIEELQSKLNELKRKLGVKSGDDSMVIVNTAIEYELQAYKDRCLELASQVQNFHQQNNQLMQDLQQVNNLKIQIQAENSILNDQNLDLQKKLQSFLSDINRTRYSVGGIASGMQETNRHYDYSSTTNQANVLEKENKVSVSEKTDIELLAIQTYAVSSERVKSSESNEILQEELKGKLKLECELSTQQKEKLNGQEMEISKLKSQLSEKDQMLGHYKEQLDTQIAHMTEEHKHQKQDLVRQLDILNMELQHTRTSLPYMGNVQNLKSQVMSLINENQELSNKLHMATKTLNNKLKRVTELEQQCFRGDEERRDGDNIIKSLRGTLSSYEDTICKERQEHANTKKQLIELRASFNQLVNDYKELLDTFDDYKAQQYQQQPGHNNKQLMDEINRLTAQTIAAEEAITYRDDQIKQLKLENAHLKDDIDNTIPVLKAQAEVWKQDFDAERYARERQVQEKETIIQEMRNLELKNQQLVDELENYSRKSFAEMQRRHATPTYQQQLQNQLQGPGSVQKPLAFYQLQHPLRSGYQPLGNQAGENGDNNVQRIAGPPPQMAQGSSSNNRDEGEMSCPKCGVTCPDLDTLQIHVLDCIDN